MSKGVLMVFLGAVLAMAGAEARAQDVAPPGSPPAQPVPPTQQTQVTTPPADPNQSQMGKDAADLHRDREKEEKDRVAEHQAWRAYSEAVKKFGPDSPEARQARELAIKDKRAVREDRHEERVDQRDLTKDRIAQDKQKVDAAKADVHADAQAVQSEEVKLAQARAQLRQSADAYTSAIKQYGPDSPQAKAALDGLEKSESTARGDRHDLRQDERQLGRDESRLSQDRHEVHRDEHQLRREEGYRGGRGERERHERERWERERREREHREYERRERERRDQTNKTRAQHPPKQGKATGVGQVH